MPLNVTVYANPIAELIEILPNVASALATASSASNLAGTANSKIDIIDAEIINDIRPKTAKIPDLELKANTLQNGLDESLTLIFQNADEIADNKILISAAQDSISNANLAIEAVDNKAVTALGNAADLFDRVANIFSLIATLGTAIRMEQIAANSLERDELLQQQIDGLAGSITGINNKNIEQDNAINELQNAINSLDNLLQDLEALNNTQFNSLYNELLSLRTSLNGQLSSLVDLIIQTQTQVSSGFSGLPPQLRTALCEALNSGCFDFPVTPEPDLSVLETKLNQLLNRDDTSGINEILRRIGSFPNACLQGSISDALCGGSSSIANSVRDALNEYFSDSPTIDIQPIIDKVEGKGNEVLSAIDGIEVFAAIPESWQVRIEGDRPQLIVSYAEKYVDGFGKTNYARNRLNQSIPHYNGLKNWGLLPIWTRGNYQGKLILKDNSKLIVYANSEQSARSVIASLSRFVISSMIVSNSEFYSKIKSRYGISNKKAYPKYARFFPKGQKTDKANVQRYDINR